MPDAAPRWQDRVAAALPFESPPLAAALGLAAAVAVLLVVVVVAVRGTPGPAELTLPRAPSPAEPGGLAPGAVEPGGAAPGGIDAAADVFVHAAGAVLRPGVYKVASGGRVTDVVDAAGGPAADADLDQLNLAARVADGERVYVPRRGQVAPAGGPAASGPPAPLDLNTATVEQLDDLPGVGPATARAIADYRSEHGRFTSVSELLEVRGIGPAKLASLRSRVRVAGAAAGRPSLAPRR